MNLKKYFSLIIFLVFFSTTTIAQEINCSPRNGGIIKCTTGISNFIIKTNDIEALAWEAMSIIQQHRTIFAFRVLSASQNWQWKNTAELRFILDSETLLFHIQEIQTKVEDGDKIEDLAIIIPKDKLIRIANSQSIRVLIDNDLFLIKSNKIKLIAKLIKRTELKKKDL